MARAIAECRAALWPEENQAALESSNAHVEQHGLPLLSAPQPARTFDPCFEIAEETRVMCTQFMAAVPANLLKNLLASLSGQRDAIIAALDLLMQGF